jgi:hypothetical protein
MLVENSRSFPRRHHPLKPLHHGAWPRPLFPLRQSWYPGVVLDSTSQREAKRRQFIRNPKGLPWCSRAVLILVARVFLLLDVNILKKHDGLDYYYWKTLSLLGQYWVKQTNGSHFVVSKTTPWLQRKRLNKSVRYGWLSNYDMLVENLPSCPWCYHPSKPAEKGMEKVSNHIFRSVMNS